MIEANDGGAGVTVNGATWSTQNNQPTQEIYRIDVDTRWPYWVYGAQQDNSIDRACRARTSASRIVVGGGESGYIAVDPRNSNIIYAGNYGGSLQRAGSLHRASARTCASTPTRRPASARRT